MRVPSMSNVPALTRNPERFSDSADVTIVGIQNDTAEMEEKE